MKSNTVYVVFHKQNHRNEIGDNITSDAHSAFHSSKAVRTDCFVLKCESELRAVCCPCVPN